MKKTPALFSYRNSNSAVHKIPASLKLILMIVVTLRTFSNTTYLLSSEQSAIFLPYIPWIRTGFYFLITAIFFFLAKTPFKTLLKLRFILWIGGLLAFLSLINGNFSALTSDLLYIFRFFVTTLFSLIVFETTSKLEILDSLSDLENAICKIIPAARKLNFALILSITITFIPKIFSAWNKISLAGAARSKLKKNGKRKFSLSSANAQITALFLNMLQYAEELRRAVINRIS